MCKLLDKGNCIGCVWFFFFVFFYLHYCRCVSLSVCVLTIELCRDVRCYWFRTIIDRALALHESCTCRVMSWAAGWANKPSTDSLLTVLKSFCFLFSPSLIPWHDHCLVFLPHQLWIINNCFLNSVLLSLCWALLALLSLCSKIIIKICKD